VKTVYDTILAPVLSEKAYEGYAGGRYVFWVQPGANKTEIKQAIEQAFKVDVVKINVANLAGKTKRRGRFFGPRPARKKAFVTVANGQRIEALEGLI
jgi:large subunit ribosomal protein L23